MLSKDIYPQISDNLLVAGLCRYFDLKHNGSNQRKRDKIWKLLEKRFLFTLDIEWKETKNILLNVSMIRVFCTIFNNCLPHLFYGYTIVKIYIDTARFRIELFNAQYQNAVWQMLYENRDKNIQPTLKKHR